MISPPPLISFASIALVLSTAPLSAQVSLTASDPAGTSSFGLGTRWSDGLAPSSDKDYLVSLNNVIRTPENSSDHTFAGRSLTLDNGVIAFKTVAPGAVTINQLIVKNGSLQNWNEGSQDAIIRGNILLDNGDLNLYPSAESRVVRVESTITGSGSIVVSGSGTNAGNSNRAELTGNNSYTGITTVTSTGKLRITHDNALGATGAGNHTLLDGSNGSSNRAVLEIVGGVTTAEDFILRSSSGSSRARLNSVSGGVVTLTGNITIDGSAEGRVEIAPDSGSTLNLNGNVTQTIPNTYLMIRGGGTGNINGTFNLGTNNFFKTDAGTWNLNSGGHTWKDAQIAVGTFRMGAANVLPSTSGIVMGQNDTNSAVLDLNGFNQTVLSLNHNGSGSNLTNKTITSTSGPATLTINNTGAAATYQGVLAGQLNLVKLGAGNQTLAGSNTYTGTTLIDSTDGSMSVLTLAHNNALGSTTGGTTIQNTAGVIGGTGNQLSLTNNITVSENLTLIGGTNGDRRVSLVNTSGNNTWAGNITFQAGGAGTQIYSNDGSGSLNISGNITGNRGFSLRGGSGNVNNRITGNINIGTSVIGKTDAGTWTLASNGNTFGDLNVQDGLIRLGIDNAIPLSSGLVFGQGSSTVGRFDLNGFNQEVAKLDVDNNSTSKISHNLTNSSATRSTFTVNNNSSQVYEGKITGNLNLTKKGTGTLTLGGSDHNDTHQNTYTGKTHVQGGTLALTNNVTLGSSEALQVDSGATFDISGRNSNYTYAGNISGNGRLVTGSNQLIHTGILSPGESPGTLTVSGKLKISNLEADLFNPTSDRIVVENGSTLDISGATLFGHFGGSSANLYQGTPNSSNLIWLVDNQNTDSSGLIGYFANATEMEDGNAWFGGATPWMTNIDGQEFALFYQANMNGSGLGIFSGGNDLLMVAVPEPGKSLLFLLSAAGLMLKRRRAN